MRELIRGIENSDREKEESHTGLSKRKENIKEDGKNRSILVVMSKDGIQRIKNRIIQQNTKNEL